MLIMSLCMIINNFSPDILMQQYKTNGTVEAGCKTLLLIVYKTSLIFGGVRSGCLKDLTFFSKFLSDCP